VHCFFADHGKRENFLLGIFAVKIIGSKISLRHNSRFIFLIYCSKKKQKQMSASLNFNFNYSFKPGAFGRTKSDLKWQAF